MSTNKLNEMTSGQVFVRDMGKSEDGRRLTLLLGVVAGLPDEFQGETQYTLAGMPNWQKEFAGTDVGEQLTLRHEGAISHGKKFSGYRADQIVTYPIWRV